MSQYLKDKVVLITGAGSGFGKLISEMAAERGALVVGTDVNEAALTAVFDGISASGGQGVAVVADVTSPAEMKAAVARAVEVYGRVDILLNNAGVMPLAFFSDHERAIDKWNLSIDINVKGVLNGIAAVYDQMIAQGRGHVVNISSIFANAGIEGAGVYSASKAAVSLISDSLRAEAKGKIKVTTVKPTGVFGTNLGASVINENSFGGPIAQRMGTFAETMANFASGTLPREKTDIDDIRYWLIQPEDIAREVIHVIDQPWGISISDITVRASGDDFVY